MSLPWITDLKEGKLDPRFMDLMAHVDLIAGELPDNKNRIRFYSDMYNTFYKRLKELRSIEEKPFWKFW